MNHLFFKKVFRSIALATQGLVFSLGGAVVFYTCFPLPSHWPLSFDRLARWAPFVGILIGGLLGIIDWGMAVGGIPIFLRSVGVVALWVGMTGGLHLDGAMDTADGLAVGNPQRRLEVMADSVTGAFGVMVGILILLLKGAALTELEEFRGLALMAVAGWGRWAQVMTIAFYSYLKPKGKGAFHQASFLWPQDALVGLLLLVGVTVFHLGFLGENALQGVVVFLASVGISLLVGWYFDRKLGGYTGDTLGAVVEWTETLLLCLWAVGT